MNIEAERERLGLSKSEFAKKLGIALKTYYNWINGDFPIPSDVLIRMSQFAAFSNVLTEISSLLPNTNVVSSISIFLLSLPSVTPSALPLQRGSRQKDPEMHSS